MKNALLISLAVIVAIAVALATYWPYGDGSGSPTTAPAETGSVPSRNTAGAAGDTNDTRGSFGDLFGDTGGSGDPADATEAAVNPMAEARVHGDPRTPPIIRSEREYERASEDELTDYDLYQEYELRQNERVYASFIRESEAKIAQLEDLLAKGEAAGLPESELEVAREKIRRLTEMREQLISENPQLAPEKPGENE